MRAFIDQNLACYVPHSFWNVEIVNDEESVKNHIKKGNTEIVLQDEQKEQLKDYIWKSVCLGDIKNHNSLVNRYNR